MNGTEIQWLSVAVAFSTFGGAEVYWLPNSVTAKKVVVVGPRKEEFSECVTFLDGTYAALDGCDISDFAIVRRLEPTDDNHTSPEKDNG